MSVMLCYANGDLALQGVVWRGTQQLYRCVGDQINLAEGGTTDDDLGTNQTERQESVVTTFTTSHRHEIKD